MRVTHLLAYIQHTSTYIYMRLVKPRRTAKVLTWEIGAAMKSCIRRYHLQLRRMTVEDASKAVAGNT